jgi:hypothetical protein
MAHFAQIDKNNKVLQVIVVANEELINNGVESESKGISFCKSLLGSKTNWVQTSYNATIRKNYAGIGFTYDEACDAFIPPQPFESWTLNKDVFQWEAPVLYPNDGHQYLWDEETCTWVEISA